MHLNWVHEMHGRVAPIKVPCIKLVSSCLSDPFTPPTDTTALLVARYLLIITLVVWQMLTSTHTHAHTQTYGHVNVSIVDGGIPKWVSNGYPTVSGPAPEYPAGTYTPTFHPELVRDYEAMLQNRTTNVEQVSWQRSSKLYQKITFLDIHV